MNSKFLAFGKDQMHSQANPQSRHAGAHPFDERFDEAQASQIADRVTEGADSRENQLVRTANNLRIRCDLYIVAQAAQRVLDTAEVVQLVIDNGDHDDVLWNRGLLGLCGWIGK